MRSVLLAVVIVLSVIVVGSTQVAPKRPIDRVYAPIPFKVNNLKVLTQIADNIVAHFEADPDRLRKGRAERQRLVDIVEDILIQSLHAEGYVRLEPIVVKQ